jgi:hypothetical protein
MATPNTLEKAIWLKLMGLGIIPGAGLGNVFYVDGINGNDLWDGLTPATPFATITYALTQCVADNDDYIIVLDHWQEVVAINVTRVHIIGIPHNPNHSFVQMSAAADTAIFTVTALANNCEIAGFSFGGGATHASIENVGGTPMGLYIHDCQFGHAFASNAPQVPQDGIRIDINATNIRVERCSFYGVACCGTLTRDGIRWTSGGDPLNGTIIDNQFLGCPNVGINFLAVAANTGGITIKDNIFACPGDVQGCAVTLQANCAGFLVVGNKALYGDVTAAMIQNPYLDAAPAFNNHWMANYKGNALVDPA